jgi:hypothetical protein
MASNRRAVTYCARAKLLSLLGGEKRAVIFKTPPLGSLEILFLDDAPKGDWVFLEMYPRIYADAATYKRLGTESSIDFDFDTQEFIIKRDA